MDGFHSWTVSEIDEPLQLKWACYLDLCPTFVKCILITRLAFWWTCWNFPVLPLDPFNILTWFKWMNYFSLKLTMWPWPTLARIGLFWLTLSKLYNRTCFSSHLLRKATCVKQPLGIIPNKHYPISLPCIKQPPALSSQIFGFPWVAA